MYFRLFVIARKFCRGMFPCPVKKAIPAGTIGAVVFV